jgi:hypothetical protein
MQLTAKLTQILPVESGMGRNGEWKKQNIIVETEGSYPKKVCVTVWGDKINPQWQAGMSLAIEFDLESREFNGRWYTDVKAWRIETAGGVQQQPHSPSPPQAPAGFPLPEPLPEPPAAGNFDDLPF